jgi:hypothetical protein
VPETPIWLFWDFPKTCLSIGKIYWKKILAKFREVRQDFTNFSGDKKFMSLSKIKHQDFNTSYEIAQRFSDYCDRNGTEVPAKILAKLSEFLSENLLEITVKTAVDSQEILHANFDFTKEIKAKRSNQLSQFLLANSRDLVVSKLDSIDKGLTRIYSDSVTVLRVQSLGSVTPKKF